MDYFVESESDHILIDFLESFYAQVREDELLGDVFNSTINNWDTHLRKIGVFWKSHLYEPGLYKGNPLLIHQKLHEKEAFSEEQFNRWLSLFEETADKFFEGKELKGIKRKARMIGGTLYGRLLDKELEVPGFNAFQV